METTPPGNGEPADFIDNGAVRRAMVHLRAHELAARAGHVEPYVSQENYEQAKQELADDSGGHRPQAELQSGPAMQQWDPIPGSFGHQIPDLSSDDAGCRPQTTPSFDAEAGEASRDQMFQTIHYAVNTSEGQS